MGQKRGTTELKVTPIDDLVKSSMGELVELPPFSEGVPFVARIKRPSMLAMVKTGRIPNSLLVEANNLFTSGPGGMMLKKSTDVNAMSELFDIIDVICEDSFVEPTYKQLQDAGITLTDDQMMFIFSYSQKGVKALESFRVDGRSAQGNRTSQNA